VKRGPIYSNRPRSVMCHELTGKEVLANIHRLLITCLFVDAGWVVSVEGYTNRLRQYRKLGHQVLNPRVVQQEYSKVIEDETRSMIQHVLEDPEKLLEAMQ